MRKEKIEGNRYWYKFSNLVYKFLSYTFNYQPDLWALLSYIPLVFYIRKNLHLLRLIYSILRYYFIKKTSSTSI